MLFRSASCTKTAIDSDSFNFNGSHKTFYNGVPQKQIIFGANDTSGASFTITFYSVPTCEGDYPLIGKPLASVGYCSLSANDGNGNVFLVKNGTNFNAHVSFRAGKMGVFIPFCLVQNRWDSTDVKTFSCNVGR